MELIFQGHDYKYAVEQIMLMLFPEERPVYPADGQPSGSFYAVVALREDASTIAAKLRAMGAPSASAQTQ